VLTCPLCKKTIKTLVRECPTCRTDLSLLADFMTEVDAGLRRAEEQARAGQLGEAMWAYLAVLEVDPENPIARRQVGLVATAVRQFDRSRPRRSSWPHWRLAAAATIVVALALAIGFLAGRATGPATDEPPQLVPKVPGLK